MTHHLNKLQREAESIRMTKAEKSAMLARVLGAPSPVVLHKSPYVFLSFMSREVRLSLTGFALFIMAGLSTVSAAQGALPGDLLYPVKLSINEKVEMAFAAEGADKAALEVRLAERRVEEAQSLAAQGRLDEKSAESLAMSFDAHAQNAQDLADASEPSEPGIAAQVKTKLSASLSVQGAVLKTLGKGSAANSANQQQSDALGDRVIARAEGPIVAMNARSFAATAEAEPVALKASMDASGGGAPQTMALMAADASAPAATEDPQAQKKAARLQKKAAESIADARALFKEVRPKLDASVADEVEKNFTESDLAMSAGAEALGAGEYVLAQEHFTSALQVGGRLEALLKAEKKFDNGILKSLIQTATLDRGLPADIPASDAAASASLKIGL